MATISSIIQGYTGLVVTAGTNLTGTTLAPNIVTSSLTRVGTLTSLNVSGNVGIGRTTVGAKLDVEGRGRFLQDATPTTGAIVLRQNSGDTSGAYIQWVNNANSVEKGWFTVDTSSNMIFATVSSERMRITSTRLSLTGTGARGFSGSVITTPNDTVANAIRSSGYIEWTTDVGAIGTNYFLSDERKKDNIQPATVEALPVIGAIKTIDFDWKEGSGQEGHIEVGVSAQQLQKVNSRFVAELSDGTLMVRDPAILPYMIKAIQELNAKVDALQAELATLKA